MVEFNFLTSTAVMGVILVVTVLVIAGRSRLRTAPEGGQPPNRRLRTLANSPAGWSVGFLLLVGIALGGTVLYITNTVVPTIVSALLIGLLTLSVLGYLLWGVYDAARHRGLHAPAGIAAAAWMAGMLFVLGVVLRLLEFV